MYRNNSLGRLFSKPVFMMTFKKTLPQGVLLILAGVLLPAYAIYMIAENKWPPGHIHLFCKDFLMGVSLLAPLFVFPAFSHLSNKRKSDLIESLPESRVSFAISALSVCLLWQVAIGLVTLGVCLFAPLFVKKYAFSQLFASGHSVISVLLSALLGLYVLALSFLAVSLCGRLEGAILTLIVLLGVPGMVVLSAEFVFYDTAEAGNISPFFLMGVPFMRLILSEENSDFHLKTFHLFTALFETILLFGAGFFVYTHRKSEKSGALTLSPALSRLLLSLLTLLPFFISLLFFSAEFSFHYTESPTLGSVLANVAHYLSKGIYLYLFAASLAAFPVFALLVERRPLGMVKALLTYTVTVGATVLWIVALALIYCLWA